MKAASPAGARGSAAADESAGRLSARRMQRRRLRNGTCQPRKQYRSVAENDPRRRRIRPGDQAPVLRTRTSGLAPIGRLNQNSCSLISHFSYPRGRVEQKQKRTETASGHRRNSFSCEAFGWCGYRRSMRGTLLVPLPFPPQRGASLLPFPTLRIPPAQRSRHGVPPAPHSKGNVTACRHT